MAIISIQLIVMYLPNPLYYQDYVSKCEVVCLDTLYPLVYLFGIILKDYEMWRSVLPVEVRLVFCLHFYP